MQSATMTHTETYNSSNVAAYMMYQHEYLFEIEIQSVANCSSQVCICVCKELVK